MEILSSTAVEKYTLSTGRILSCFTFFNHQQQIYYVVRKKGFGLGIKKKGAVISSWSPTNFISVD